MMQMMNESDERPCPAMKSRPNMVENHSVFTDITQSVAMKVTAKAQKMMPGAASLAIVWRGLTPPSRSSRSDHIFRNQAQNDQPPR